MNTVQSGAERTKLIADLNDLFRRGKASGERVLTPGVITAGSDFPLRATQAVREFDDFTLYNDSHGEHDFGAFEIDGEKLFWKIDYYDRSMEHASADPENPEVTIRVLTIMLVGEAYLVATGKIRARLKPCGPTPETPTIPNPMDGDGLYINEECACNGELCIRSVPGRDDEEPDVLVIDAITDIMHLCVRDGIDFDQCHRIAEHHFQAERENGGNYVHADAR